MRRIPAPVWFAGIPAALVVLAGMILSYNALAVLALSAGIDPVLSWAYPGVIDGVIITGSIAAYVLRRARLRIRMYLWSLIGVAVGLSIVGNATHALTHGGLMTLPPLAAAAVSAVPPASLAAALHVIVVLWRALGTVSNESGQEAGHDSNESLIVEDEASQQAVAEMATLAAHEEAPNDRQTVHRSGTRQRDNRRRVARLVRRQPDVTASETAKRLGVSRSTASRLLSEVRKSHAVVRQETVAN